MALYISIILLPCRVQVYIYNSKKFFKEELGWITIVFQQKLEIFRYSLIWNNMIITEKDFFTK